MTQGIVQKLNKFTNKLTWSKYDYDRIGKAVTTSSRPAIPPSTWDNQYPNHYFTTATGSQLCQRRLDCSTSALVELYFPLAPEAFRYPASSLADRCHVQQGDSVRPASLHERPHAECFEEEEESNASSKRAA